MNIEKFSGILIRVFLMGAFLILTVAVFEKALNLMGQSVLGFNPLPHTLLIWSAVLLVFVIALLLIQIRDAVRAS